MNIKWQKWISRFSLNFIYSHKLHFYSSWIISLSFLSNPAWQFPFYLLLNEMFTICTPLKWGDGCWQNIKYLVNSCAKFETSMFWCYNTSCCCSVVINALFVLAANLHNLGIHYIFQNCLNIWDTWYRRTSSKHILLFLICLKNIKLTVPLYFYGPFNTFCCL